VTKKDNKKPSINRISCYGDYKKKPKNTFFDIRAQGLEMGKNYIYMKVSQYTQRDSKWSRARIRQEKTRTSPREREMGTDSCVIWG